MKSFILLGSLLLGTMTITFAQQATPAKPAVVSSSVMANSVLDPVYTDGKCRFRIKNFPMQRYDTGMYMFDPTKEDPAGWSFSFGCNAGASQSDVYDQIGAKPVDGKWIDLDFNTPFKAKQKFKLIKFAGKNWKGIGTSVDQIYYADADRRSRFFNFCLVENNGPQVLCGRTQIRGVTQPPSASKLPKIIAVLKTIEFVNSPASQTVSSH